MEVKKFSDIELLEVGSTIQLVGGIWQGPDRDYLCFLPGEGPSESERACFLHMTQDEWTKFVRQTDLMEVEILSRAADGSLVKAIKRKSERQIDQGVSWSVFRRDGYCCRYCGKDNVPLTVDHLVLWEDGGPSIVENLVSACRKCNRTRGRVKYGDWLKHPYYLDVSQMLRVEERAENERLLFTLDQIPIAPKIKSR